MNNNEMFLSKYRELENLLKHRYENKRSSSSPVYSYIRELYLSPYEKNHERGEKLDSIRELRNQMSHKNVDGILTIDNEAIDFLEKEINLINNPINAYDICIKLNEIHYATLSTNLNNVMKIMISYGYSHIPVLKNKHLIGVFSENTIFSIYNQAPDILQNKDLTLGDIENYLKLENHQTECFAFVSKKTNTNEIINRFQKRKENNKRLTVFFVTNSGKKNEPLIGMITPYDALIK